MVFRFILADPTPRNAQAAMLHDSRVTQIRSAQVSSIFFPTPNMRYRPLKFLDYPGKYAVLLDSRGDPVCAVEVLTTELCLLREISRTDITRTLGPDELDAWRSWALEEWSQPLSGKSYWNTPIGEDSEIVRVDFRLVDTFPAPMYHC